MDWAAALDALEADVAAVEAVLADDTDTPVAAAWTPPDDLGPLPLDLVPRAEALLARQFNATQAVGLALTANRKLSTAAARIEAGSPGAPRPAYVDYSA